MRNETASPYRRARSRLNPNTLRDLPAQISGQPGLLVQEAAEGPSVFPEKVFVRIVRVDMNLHGLLGVLLDATCQLLAAIAKSAVFRGDRLRAELESAATAICREDPILPGPGDLCSLLPSE